MGEGGAEADLRLRLGLGLRLDLGLGLGLGLGPGPGLGLGLGLRRKVRSEPKGGVARLQPLELGCHRAVLRAVCRLRLRRRLAQLRRRRAWLVGWGRG